VKIGYEYSAESGVVSGGFIMKTLMFSMVLAGMLLPLAGCETLTDTKAENEVRLRHAMANNLQQMNGDTEYVLLLERPSWLSRFPVPND
jgi:hypothetical protein